MCDFSTGRLGRSAAVPDGRIQRSVVRGWHRQLGRGVRYTKSAGCVCQRAHVHGMDQEQHTHRPAVFVDRRRVLNAIFREQNAIGSHLFVDPIPMSLITYLPLFETAIDCIVICSGFRLWVSPTGK